MTNAVSTIDTRKFLKESVKSYIEEYKTERYERESKARNEARIEKNIQNILSEQTLSLDDIAKGFSVDPFTGEKVKMEEVTPPPSPKFVAKGKTLPSKDPKTAPVVPTTAKDLKRTGKKTEPRGILRNLRGARGRLSRNLAEPSRNPAEPF